MKKNILKLRPHFEYRVWANDNLKKIFHLSNELIGEAWLVSALEGKSSIITNLPNEQDLLSFYKNKDNAYFFNNYNLEHEYPLLSKIIDAKEDLSVQIHPDDKYAKKFNSLGKTECWYVLDTKNDNSIILGHNAKDINDFKNKIKSKKWNELLKKIPIKKGDFVYVESTKIHAIKSETLIFELQQSSDITYRVYDYDRLDNGKKRDLHLEHVYNLIKTPDVDLELYKITNRQGYLVSNNLFNLKLIKNKNKNEYIFNDAMWLQVTIIEGFGYINNLRANKYDSFLIAYNEKIILDGEIELLISYINC